MSKFSLKSASLASLVSKVKFFPKYITAVYCMYSLYISDAKYVATSHKDFFSMAGLAVNGQLVKFEAHKKTYFSRIGVLMMDVQLVASTAGCIFYLIN